MLTEGAFLPGGVRTGAAWETLYGLLQALGQRRARLCLWGASLCRAGLAGQARSAWGRRAVGHAQVSGKGLGRAAACRGQSKHRVSPRSTFLSSLNWVQCRHGGAGRGGGHGPAGPLCPSARPGAAPAEPVRAPGHRTRPPVPAAEASGGGGSLTAGRPAGGTQPAGRKGLRETQSGCDSLAGRRAGRPGGGFRNGRRVSQRRRGRGQRGVSVWALVLPPLPGCLHP